MSKDYKNGKINEDGSITSAFVQRNFTTVKAMAAKNPVAVTVHGRTELVILTKEDYERLCQPALTDAGM